MVAVEPVAAASGPLSALISATNPVTFLGSLSYRGWFGLGLVALVSYCNWISTLSRRPKDAPCPEFGRECCCGACAVRGLFGTLCRGVKQKEHPRQHPTSSLPC